MGSTRIVPVSSAMRVVLFQVALHRHEDQVCKHGSLKDLARGMGQLSRWRHLNANTRGVGNGSSKDGFSATSTKPYCRIFRQ